jgi:P-type Ca2+ transporter type 2C
MKEQGWHEDNILDALHRIESTPEGITMSEATQRLQKTGPNELTEGARKSAFAMFLEQFKDFMILVLIGAAVISGIIGDLSDTVVILIIVVANAIIGFVQEYRAEKAMAALKKMASPETTVIRSASAMKIPSSQLVYGDIVILEAGSIIPADMRLIEAIQLKVDEAALTGESVPVDKHTEPIHHKELALADRLNMVFKGTAVTYGRGKGLVVGTGMNTELGNIASMLQNEEDVKTPLQKRLAVFGRKLALAVLIICAIVFGMGLLRGEPPLLMLLTAISLAVAAIPEALPAVITIALALGAKKMVKQNALVKKLPAVETLGSVTFICSDKTGTLTLNQMALEELWADGVNVSLRNADPKTMTGLFTGLALSNDAWKSEDGRIMGDPTEIALFLGAQDSGFFKVELEKTMPRIAELPFDSERKAMTTIHKDNNQWVSFTKGAPDMLLPKCRSQWAHQGIAPLDSEAVIQANDKMAYRGLRVLGVAMRQWPTMPETLTPEDVESDMVFLGLVGMMDPPRTEAIEAVTRAKNAGIKPVMITGDHPATAYAIAQRVGILTDDNPVSVMTGHQLNELSIEEFEKIVEEVKVYARVAPEQKLKIVRALQDRGQFAAMTGDGVNDAPALKRADIGIAMGITGTDVSKEAAHMILLDDNFATIVKAVAEGRKIYDNVRKFIKYLLTTNSGEIWTLFLAPILGLPVPLLPIHILWINLVTDGLPALALSMEPAEGNVMKRPPRHPKESIFAHGLGYHALWVGLLMGGLVLGTQVLSMKYNDGHWQTMVFSVLCLTQLGHVLAIRSERQSLFKQGLLSNKTLLLAVGVAFLLQMITIYVPVLNAVFHTQPLNFMEMVLVLCVSSLVFVAVEIEKWIKRRMSA